MPSPKQILTQNGHSGSLEVIFFGVTEEPLRSCIEQYNNYGLGCRFGSTEYRAKEANNRHFRRPHSHFTPPFRRTPANIRINLTLLETMITGLHFCRWQYMGSSADFRTVLSESQRPNPLVAEPETHLTQNGNSRSFTVIYFDVNEEPLKDYT